LEKKCRELEKTNRDLQKKSRDLKIKLDNSTTKQQELQRKFDVPNEVLICFFELLGRKKMISESFKKMFDPTYHHGVTRQAMMELVTEFYHREVFNEVGILKAIEINGHVLSLDGM
jgi:hypothetical protein